MAPGPAYESQGRGAVSRCPSRGAWRREAMAEGGGPVVDAVLPRAGLQRADAAGMEDNPRGIGLGPTARRPHVQDRATELLAGARPQVSGERTAGRGHRASPWLAESAFPEVSPCHSPRRSPCRPHHPGVARAGT